MGGAAQEQGVVCAHGGAWLHLGGAEDVIHHIPVGQPRPSLQSNPQQQKLPKGGHVLRALPVQQAEAVLELKGEGGSICVVFGWTPPMLPVRGPLREQRPLHLLPGGEGEPVVPGGADEDEDLPLLEEDLVPPLLLGLPQRRSRLDMEAELGGEGHKSEDVAAGGGAVTGGQHVRGGRNIRVRELVPRRRPRHDDRTRHVKQAFEGVGDTLVDAAYKFFNKGTSQALCFGGLGLVPLGEGGVHPLLLHRFRIEHRVKMLRNLVPRPPNVFHPPPGGVPVIREKNIAVHCVTEAVPEVTSHRGGWAVIHHGGVSGGIGGGVLQSCRAQGGLGRNKSGGVRDTPIPTQPLHPMESGQSDIGDVVERRHGRVAGQDAQVVPPLGLHCLPLKRKVRVVSRGSPAGK